MKIVKRLKTPYSDGVDAVLLNDEGEEYPVFLESLHNTVVFPLLIESGYVLEKLPYGFIKDGMKFDQIPKEEFNPDEKTEELMYNSIGAKVPLDEIKKHVISSPSSFPIPETNYTIFTREDFITYLEAVAVSNSDDDYMPLNYFVAPDARFTIDEWRNPAYLKYVKTISNRRYMSLSKFRKLVNFLLKINLAPNYTVMDILDAYFAWGIDGLQFSIINRRRESRAFRLVPNRTINAPMINTTYGLVDGLKNIFVPEHLRDMHWRLSNKDPRYLDTITSGMKPEDTAMVCFNSGAKQDVTTLEGPTYNIRYSPDIVMIQLQTYPTFMIQSPVSTNKYLDLELALPNKEDELYAHCKIEALSKLLYEYRVPRVVVSSYEALKVAGCNPKTVLDYIVTKYDMSREVKDRTEDTAPKIMDYDIDEYLSNPKNMSDDIRSFLNDVVNGVFNIDNIDSGKRLEASVNLESVYREIYVLYYVLGISFQEIYDKIRTITPDMKELVFNNGKLNYRMDVSPMTYSMSGYKRDLMSYDLQNAKDCTFFSYVTLIAREVGDERARRHVGIEFYMVNKKYAAVKEVLDNLRKNYSSRVYSMIPDVTLQTKQMQMIDMFALSRYFEIALKGTITWPQILGGEVTPAMPSTINTCQKYMERKIECTTTYCSFTARTQTVKSLSFNAYCVNAYITPEYVIPRSDAPIREIPFFAAWFDWRRCQPDTWRALVDNNVIPVDFVSWDQRYPNEQFMQRNFLEMDSNDSLMYYYDLANTEISEYPDDKDFISVSHPIEYMFPGLCDEEDKFSSVDTLPVPRVGNPVARLGITHDLTRKDYEDKLLPSSEVVAKDSYIRPFKGFDAAMLMNVDNILEIVPVQTEYSLTVMERSESVYVPDTKEVMNYSRITQLDANKYGIIHVCDRNYMFRSTNGKIWEVKI